MPERESSTSAAALRYGPSRPMIPWAGKAPGKDWLLMVKD